MVAPEDPAPENPRTKTIPLTVPEGMEATEESTSEEDAPVIPSSPRRWPLAALGAVLLLAGGGFLFLRTDSTPAPATLPEIAQPSSAGTAPLPAPEDPPPAPVAETTPLAPDPANPSSGTPPSGSPPAVKEDPPKVAEVTTPPDPQPAQPKSPKPVRQPGKNPVKPPSLTPSTSKPVGKGTLAFRVRPFASIFINGKNYGQTPFDPVELPAGTYTVRLVNDDLKKNVIQTVELKPGEAKVVKLNLEE
jgi:serine/threonine-protein kinase